ncbi:hypothetical protein EON65_08640 [archaeon]|nr:MAG: hypothetical protein EON65_08640 [archaeon]
MTTLLLTFNDHFLNWDTSVYEERHFIAHVQACDTLQTKIGSIYIDTIGRKLVIDTDACSGLSAKESAKSPDKLYVSPTVQDAVKSTCAWSAYTAVTQLVRRLQDSKLYLLQGLLIESNMAWLTGQLCSTFVSNLDQWCSFVCDSLPPRFMNVLYVRVSRLMLCMYVAQMIDHHKEKKRTVHTEGGVRQIVQDAMAIKAWMSRTCHQQAAAEEQVIITVQSFLLVSQKDMTQAFSEALLSFGVKYAFHLYDLLRLALKYRPDVSNNDRKAVLGLCLEFTNQVQKAMSADSFSFSLPTVDCTILDELFPMVGVEFCTGRKWKLAPLPDPNVVKSAMAVLVGETCNKAMASKRATINITAGKKASDTSVPIPVISVITV